MWRFYGNLFSKVASTLRNSLIGNFSNVNFLFREIVRTYLKEIETVDEYILWDTYIKSKSTSRRSCMSLSRYKEEK